MATSSVDFARYVQLHAPAAAERLVAYFAVSDRTIRSYVLRANRDMEGFARISRTHEGYELVVEDQAAYDEWLERAATREVSFVPSTQEERVVYLLNDLLERADWITLEELSHVLYVSKSRLSRCMGQVEATLSHFDLKLEKRPRYGMRVIGSEFNRRLCLASLAVKSLSEAEEGDSLETPHAKVFRTLVGSSIGGFDDRELLEGITSCVSESAREADFHINAAAHQNLIVHIGVALVRIQSGCYVPMGDEKLESMRGSREFQVAQAIATRVSERFGIELPEEEVAYIAIHLAGKQAFPGGSGDSSNLVISDEVWDVVSDMLDAVWNAFRFDFRTDLELRMNLARHIVPLSVRLRYHMPLKNPLVSDMRARYPLAYSMAIEGASVLSRHYEAELSEDEIGYIAFAFALALERQKTGRPKKNILMVCASGAGSARLLEYRVRHTFGNDVGEVHTCDAFSVADADFSHIDYVFTTVPIHRSLPVPVFEVSYFLDSSEVAEVRGAIRTVEAESADFSQIDEALILPHLRFTNKAELLDFLLDSAEASFPVSASFRELVWKREAMMATALGNRVAMPHPIEPACERTGICIGLLDEPVPWDDQGHVVQVVFLMAFARGASTELRELLAALATVFFSPEAVDDLIAHQDRETLKRLLAWAQQENAEPD